MATQPTQNPVPSESPRDLKFNAGKIDEFVTSDDLFYVDRFGGKHYTQRGLEDLFQQFLLQAGYVFVGDYEDGPLTFAARNQYIRYYNQYWRLNAATNVGFTTTGTDATSWASDVTHFVLIDGDTLRQELASPRGSTLVASCPDVATLRGLTGLTVGQEIQLKGYWAFAPGIGGGRLYISDDTTTADNGFTCFVTTDGKRIKRHPDTILTVTMAGAVGDGSHINEDTAGFQRAADAGISILVPQPADFFGINDSTVNKGILPANTGTKFYSFSNAKIKLMSSRCNIFSNFVRDFTLTGYGPITDFGIDGLHLIGNYENLADPASASFPAGDNYSFGVYMVMCKNVTIKNSLIEGFWYGGSNLFSVLGQVHENVEYKNIGPDNAYYPNYSAAGSDAGWRAASGKVVYKNIKVTDCGGIIRANGGVNNGASPVSSDWHISKVDSLRTKSGIGLFGCGYQNVTITDIVGRGCSKGRLVSVSGEGENYGRTTPVTDVNISNIHAYDCMNDSTLTGSGLIYLMASNGNNSVKKVLIVGGNVAGNSNDAIVLGGAFIGAAMAATGETIVDDIHIEFSGLNRSHVRTVMPMRVSISNVMHKSGIRSDASWMLDLVAGCNVNIHDNKLLVSGHTGKYVPFNWTSGQLVNVNGFKTTARGTDNLKNGDTITHGLIDTPAHFSAHQRTTGAPASIGYTTPNNTTIVISMYSSGAAITTSVPVSWEARCIHEYPL